MRSGVTAVLLICVCSKVVDVVSAFGLGCKRKVSFVRQLETWGKRAGFLRVGIGMNWEMTLASSSPKVQIAKQGKHSRA